MYRASHLLVESGGGTLEKAQELCSAMLPAQLIGLAAEYTSRKLKATEAAIAAKQKGKSHASAE